MSFLLSLLLAALTYVFGTSIADYLGKPFLVAPFWLGLLIVLLAQAIMNLLPEVFRLDAEPLLENETRSKRQILRNNLLYTSLACIVIFALTAHILFANKTLPLSSFLFLLLSLAIVFTYSIPPFRFVNRGAGEFLLAVHLAYVVPSIAFTLQADETHRFLALAVPLTLLAFSYFIMRDFQSFAQDQKYNRVTFLTRLGWERVAPLHHLFVLLAYFLFTMSPLFGSSLSLIWPVFLTLPFALFQIFLLRNISLGAKPNWTLLHATALAVFGLAAYFLTLTFWLR
ncbi:MAG TPA: UbiA family prenyltransferase [Anaerolineales bacterium]|nr:UbiA family prenyltransferase [Anaerolineales bacterium]HMR98181.1 UbiA family prenyltransferase [Anaerolineales bacterium]HNQ95969.1 UbiA family prenyltransferase [Anaerolineales bacterium]HNS60595.1 UbiA family prenyltransferase [Anaerolineales bacterium]